MTSFVYHLLVLVCLVATATTSANPIEKNRCSRRANKLYDLLAKQRDELTSYATETLVCPGDGQDAYDCLRKDQRVGEGVKSLISMVKELGEMRACADGSIKSARDVREAQRDRLEEASMEVEAALDEMDRRSRQLYQVMLEALNEAMRQL